MPAAWVRSKVRLEDKLSINHVGLAKLLNLSLNSAT